MRPELEQIEEIENYLLGKLKEEDKIRFEKKLESSAELRDQVKIQSMLMEGIESIKWKEELNVIHHRYQPFYRKPGFLILLGIALLAFLGFFILQSKQNKEGKSLPGISKQDKSKATEDTVKFLDQEAKQKKEEDYSDRKINDSEKRVDGNNPLLDTKEDAPVHYQNEVNTGTSILKKSYYLFPEKKERRLLWVPLETLNYDLLYTNIIKSTKVNGQIESFYLPKFENTFIASIPFHYRIEGCLRYSPDMLQIYLKNTDKKLWEADSLVLEYLAQQMKKDCENYNKYKKAHEYFRWLKSEKYGHPVKLDCMDRNFRRGQAYDVISNKKEEEYLSNCGIPREEVDGILGYFINGKSIKNDFKNAIKEGHHLDYYYKDGATVTEVPVEACD